MQDVFCVQTYRKQGRRVEAGELRRFALEAPARREGKHLAARSAGVLVFRVSADPEEDRCTDLEVIARYGDAPIISSAVSWL